MVQGLTICSMDTSVHLTHILLSWVNQSADPQGVFSNVFLYSIIVLLAIKNIRSRLHLSARSQVSDFEIIYAPTTNNIYSSSVLGDRTPQKLSIISIKHNTMTPEPDHHYWMGAWWVGGTTQPLSHPPAVLASPGHIWLFCDSKISLLYIIYKM